MTFSPEEFAFSSLSYVYENRDGVKFDLFINICILFCLLAAAVKQQLPPGI